MFASTQKAKGSQTLLYPMSNSRSQVLNVDLLKKSKSVVKLEQAVFGGLSQVCCQEITWYLHIN